MPEVGLGLRVRGIDGERAVEGRDRLLRAADLGEGRAPGHEDVEIGLLALGVDARAPSAASRGAARLVEVGAEQGGGVRVLGVEATARLQRRDGAREVARLPLQEAEVLEGERHVRPLAPRTCLTRASARVEVAGLVERHHLLDLRVEADQPLGVVGLRVARLRRARRALA